MKRNLILVFFFITIGLATPVLAANTPITWDIADTSVVKTEIYYGTLPDRQNSSTVNVINDNKCVLQLNDGQRYHVWAKAYNSRDEASDWSNELIVITTFTSFDTSYLVSGLAISQGMITGSISQPPADPKSIYWAKDGLNVAAGQILSVIGRMYYNGTDGPVSLFLVDQATGHWLSPERMVYIDSKYASYQIDLIVFRSCSNAKLYVSCGHKAGLYQFQRIIISQNTQNPMPVTDIYLKQLLPREITGLCSAEFAWNQAPGSQGYRVRTALTRKEIEKGSKGNLLGEYLLGSGTTTLRQDIAPTLYGGIYVSVSSVANSQESVPWITWYLPGDIFYTADEEAPPLCLQGAVDQEDITASYNGYKNLTRVPGLTAGQPAGREERTDVDNNGYAGRTIDYSFIRGQYGKRMK